MIKQHDDIHKILADPSMFLWHLDAERSEVAFVPIDETSVEQAAFLDKRAPVKQAEEKRFPLASFLTAMDSWMPASGKLPRVNYIFHTAFCCSTLITRCLHVRGISTSFREPRVLMDVANMKRRARMPNTSEKFDGRILGSIVCALARPLHTGEHVLIKPTNAANNLLEDIARLPSTGSILLLYSPLTDFLISVIKKGEEGRAFVRRLFNVLALDPGFMFDVPPRNVIEMTDLQLASVVWHMQVENFLRVLARFPDMSIRTLDAEHFLADPRRSLVSMADFFGLSIDSETIETIVTGQIFMSDAKHRSRPYDKTIRQREREEIMLQYGEAIERVLAWSRQIAAPLDAKGTLPKPLG